MSDSPPRSAGRSSGARARRSAIDHIADHGEAREFPELFDGSSVDAASISTSTFSVIPPSLPATIDEDLLEDDDVVASEVDPDHTASAELDDVRSPVTDASAPTPIVVATIDRVDPLERPTSAPRPTASDPETIEPSDDEKVESGVRKPSVSEATTPAPSAPPTKSPAMPPSPSVPAAQKPATQSPATQKPATQSPATQKPKAKKPAASTAAVKKPASKKPAAKKPAARKPAAVETSVATPETTTPETTAPTPTKTTAPVADAQPVETLFTRGEERTPKHVRLASNTIVIDLPPADVQEVPADERAVAIDEEPVTTAEDLEPVTSSVAVSAEPVVSSDREDRVDEKPAAPAFAGMSVARALAGAPESAAMLTAERLLDDRRDSRRVPEGFWQKFLFDVSGRRIRLADSRAARARTALTERISRPLTGGARFVPVLTRKGGVGKTTVTTLLGMALADARDDRVIAVDANPDRGTLAERLARRSDHTVRDLVRGADSVAGYAEFSALVSRDSTRLDVLASDTDPHLSQAFDEYDYDVVARLASQYYSIVLTDCGTGIVHSVMGATLRHADTLVVVSGTSVDEARSASETLSWLEANGYPELAAEAVVVINSTTPGTPSVRLDEIEKHFESRVRNIVRVPFDTHLATGAAITFTDLGDATRLAVRELAAAVVEGLPGGRSRKASARG